MFSCRFGILICAFAGLLAAADQPTIPDQIAQLPLSFEPNLGQTDSHVQFVARSAGYTLLLGPSVAVMALSTRSGNRAAGLRMTLDGGASSAVAVPLDRQSGVSAYFLGNDSSRWLPEVPHYARVQYRSVYPGIDLIYYGNGRQVEYDFVVGKGADPGRIRLSYDGAQRMSIDAASGDLILTTALGDLRQAKPRVYQQINDSQVEVPTTYRLNGRQISFDVARYDHSRPLVMDPVLVYSSYLGANNQIADMATDATGAVYVTGLTSSFNFPVANAFQPVFDGNIRVLHTAFVTKLNPYPGTGLLTLAYSTYLGGNNYDQSSGIAVDQTGAAYISGTTNSLDFPVLNAYQSTLPSGTNGSTSGFVTKFNPYSGSGKVTLAYSTYLGGSYQQFERIAVDSTGAAYVVGASFASNFPSVNGFKPFGSFDAFVARLNPYTGTGSVTLAYSTSLATGRATAVAVDSAGAAYVTGYVFPPGTVQTANAFQATPPGGVDGFVAKVSPFTGGPVTLIYSTYLGGSGIDYPYAIAVDSAGAAYVTGSTTSTDFPVADAGRSQYGGNGDAFVTKLNPYTGTGSVTLGFSTYLGGAASDSGGGIALDSAGAVYVTGGSSSANFPILDPSPGPFVNFPQGVFVTRFSQPQGASAALTYSTLFGASAGGSGIGVDSTGAIQVAGSTTASNFPLLNPFQSTYIDLMTDALVDSDGFVAKLAPPGAFVTTPVNVTVTSPTVSSLSAGQSIVSGQAMTLTATFSGATGPPITGTVWFVGNNQGAVLCSAAVANGVATCTEPGSFEINPGADTITVGYPGDANYTLGTVTPLTFPVTKASTTTTLSISPNPPQPGPAVLIATVAVTPPGEVFETDGTATFRRNGSPVCVAVQPASQSCTYVPCNSPVTQLTFTCSVLFSGSATYDASYSGGNWTTASASPPLSLTAGKSSAQFTVTANPPSPVYGQVITVSVSAFESPGGALPTGSVTVTDASNASFPLATVQLNDRGFASVAVPSSGILALGAGGHNLGVVYAGDSNFLASSSVSGFVFVAKANTVTSLTAQTGSNVLLTASVTVVAPGAGTPTGVVQFFNGATLIGTASLPLGSGPFTAILNAGTITGNFTATYTGDANFNRSSSSAVTVANNQGSPLVSLSIIPSADPAPAGIPVVLTVSVTGTGPTGTPTGTVQLFDSATLLGAAPVSQGQATFRVTFQALGTHNLLATYSGDSNYPATSAVAGLYVTRNAASLNLTSSALTAAAGDSITFTAIVTGQASGGLPLPSGSLQFLDGATVIGSVPLNAGTAVLTVSTLAAGSHRITASYSGDADWGSASAVVNVSVIGPDGAATFRRTVRQPRQ